MPLHGLAMVKFSHIISVPKLIAPSVKRVIQKLHNLINIIINILNSI